MQQTMTRRLHMVARRANALWLIAILVAASAAVSQTPGDQALVDQYFPQRLLDEFAASHPGETPHRQSWFVAADLNRSGSPEFLVAVYGTGTLDSPCGIRVLRKENGSGVLVDEPACHLRGMGPGVSVKDLDGSGSPQVLVEMSSGAHGRSSQATYRWTGSALVEFGDGDLKDARYLDLDGDGALEAVEPPDIRPFGPDARPYTYGVHRLIGGVWTETGQIFDVFYQCILEEHQIQFHVADPAHPHLLTIVNGNGRDIGPVASAEVRLNGVLIAGPESINRQTARLTLPVATLARNTLNVRLAAEPGRALYVGIGPERAPTMSISPAAVSLGASETQQFSARFTGTDNTAVRWQLRGDESGDSFGGIDESGLYSAPATIDTAQTVTVVATRDADTASSATATIQLQPSVRVWVEPYRVQLKPSESRQFQATVHATDNGAVTWTRDPEIGTLSSSGLYTAPEQIQEPTWVYVTAASEADPSKSAYAEVLLSPPPPQVSVGPAAVTLRSSQTQQFTATVVGAQNSVVTWSRSPEVGAIDESGLYTAPAVVSHPQTVTVTATSRPDPRGKGSATIALQSRQTSAITSPVGLVAQAASRSRIDLSWSPPAQAGGGVAGYSVFRDGTYAGSTSGLSYSDLGLLRSTTYTYAVSAYDAQGDNSAPASASATTLSDPPPSGLVASYEFLEGAGDVLHDSSGYGNNGAVTGAAWANSGHNSLEFTDGSSVAVPGSPSLDLTGPFTLEAWTNPSWLVGWSPILVKEHDNGLCYGLFGNHSWPAARLFIGQEQYVSGEQRIAWEEWTHLATVYDGSALTLYLNGAPAGGTSVSGSVRVAPQRPLRIGYESVWKDDFDGMISGVRIYSRALSQAEIQTDMAGGEIVSAPGAPSGPASGMAGTEYTYSVEGAASNRGHALEYRFNWGDGTTSGWLPAGTHTASHAWAAAGAYAVIAQARCAAEATAVSSHSPAAVVSMAANSGARPTVTAYRVLFGGQAFGLPSARNRLPWQITGIQAVFSSPIASGDVNSLTGVAATGLSGLGTDTLTWTISPLIQGNYATALASTGPSAMIGANGAPIVDFSQNVKVLYGDFNDDGYVSAGDVVGVLNARTKPYDVFADIDGSGVVDPTDASIVRARGGATLP